MDSRDRLKEKKLKNAQDLVYHPFVAKTAAAFPGIDPYSLFRRTTLNICGPNLIKGSCSPPSNSIWITYAFIVHP